MALAIQGCLLSPALMLLMSCFGGGDWQFLAGMLCFFIGTGSDPVGNAA